jgi:hypothetical protein
MTRAFKQLWSLDGSQRTDHGADRMADKDGALQSELFADLTNVVGVSLEGCVFCRDIGAQI